MKYDYKVYDRIKFLSKDFKKIAIYGTGNGTERLWPYLSQKDVLTKILAVVDRKGSSMINKDYHGFRVSELEPILGDIDGILVCSELYWKEIESRIFSAMDNFEKKPQVVSFYNTNPVQTRVNNLSDYEEYIKYIEYRNLNRSDMFVPFAESQFERKEDDAKLIAFYLPQFYQMEINDRFHGKGFTEWTSSSQAIPLFSGHYQPHIPYDVGYYDLSNIETMKKQIGLAKNYGIYGFCFHYYWFSGQKTMEKPIEMLLNNKELDIKFCLNWATENWTSVWDGGKYDLIFEQKTSINEAKSFMQDILPYFKDNRYIKVDGRPLFIIYTAMMFEQKTFIELIKSFRKIAKDNGLPDIYILLSNYRGFDEPAESYGVDGIVEFPPTYMGDLCEPYEVSGYLNPYFEGKIFDLEKFVKEKKYCYETVNDNIYHSAMVSFDNTARKARWGGYVFHGASPESYKMWLSDNIKRTGQKRRNEDKFVFINSWNEWAEGSHLEPDQRFGYAFLEATKLALFENRNLETHYLEKCIKEKKIKESEMKIYIFCIESMGDIVACEPIARYLKGVYMSSEIKWVVKEQYEELLLFNPFVDTRIIVRNLDEAIKLYNKVLVRENEVAVMCHYDGRKCTMTNRVLHNNINPRINEMTYFNYGSLLENFCLTAGLEPLSDAPRFYTDEDKKDSQLKNDYVVIHAKSAEERKDWQYDKWRKIVDLILQNTELDVYEVGLESIINIDNERYHNYTTVHSLQKNAELIKCAKLFVGIDSGFAHIANCFEIEATILMGKYKNFEKPMPYTGFYKENAEDTIIYASRDTVKEIAVEEVWNTISNKLL